MHKGPIIKAKKGPGDLFDEVGKIVSRLCI